MRLFVLTRRFCLFVGLACFARNLLIAAPLPVENRVRVLVIDGFSNHDWRTTTARLLEILRADGGFVTRVSTSPDSTASPEALEQWSPPLAGVDVLIMNCNDLGRPVRWSRQVQEAIANFVARGGGMYVFHSANNAFEHWPEYNRMIGLGWRSRDFGAALEVSLDGRVLTIPAGAGEKTSHGKRVDALVRRLGDHPIHQGLPREWRVADAEIYTFVRGPAQEVEVLSYSFDNKYNRGFPVEWVVHYGQGRVYSSSLGHLWKGDFDPPAFRCAAFQTLMVRALRWLAGRKVGVTVPPDFPSPSHTSLRPEVAAP